MTTASASVLVARLTAAGETVAVAESLTGGLVAAALTDVAGASVVVRGGVVAYATDLKSRLLRVDEVLLDQAGAVDAGVAEQMASGVRSLMGATYGLATTGVAGPDQVDGHPVGTVYVAVVGPDSSRVEALSLSGDRGQVRARSVLAVLGLLAEALSIDEPGAVELGGAEPGAAEPGAEVREEPPAAHG